MHAISAERHAALGAPGRSVPLERLGLASDLASRTVDTAAEINRWTMFLGIPFVLAALFFMATLATGQLWLIGGALVTGPGLLILSFIYLSISSDTNGDYRLGS